MRTHRIPIFSLLLILLTFLLSPGLAFAREVKKSSIPGLSHGKTSSLSTTSQASSSRIPPHSPDHILVRFKETTSRSAMDSAHAGLKAASVKRFKSVKNLHLARLPKGLSIEDALSSYRNNPHVLYAEPDYEVRAYTIPNDPSFGSLWGLQNTGQDGGTPGADIDTPSAWDMTTGSKNVVVAVIDTGVDYTHEDLAENMWRNTPDCNDNGIDDDGNGYIDDCYGINIFDRTLTPMDNNSHGTHVSGTIGAVGNNSIGVTGINWNVSIMACKFLNARGAGYTSGAIECLDYVRDMKSRGVNIIATNNSWGGSPFSDSLYDAINAHKDAGILFIAAAGNSDNDIDISPVYPASYYLPHVIAVAATDRLDHKATFSDDGRHSVHLGAPGMDILSTTPSHTYTSFSGTSMAAPHVTGVAALLKAQDPSRDWKALKNILLASGNATPSLSNTITGSRLSASGALTCMNSVVASRTRPLGRALRVAVGETVNLSVLHINCGLPNGEVTVPVEPGGTLLTLKDDGTSFDLAKDDGVYSGQWTPDKEGLFSLTFPGGDVVSVHVINGNPRLFRPAVFYEAGAWVDVVAIGDVNNDGRKDVIFANVTSSSDASLYVGVMRQNPSGGFDPPIHYAVGTKPTVIGSIAVGDVNNDGRADVVVAHVPRYGTDNMFIGVFLQDGSGNLGPMIKYPTPNSSVVRIGDLNNDGLLDIVSIGETTATVDIFFQTMDGILSGPVTYQANHGGGVLELGDVNNDGLIDIVVGGVV